MKDTKLPLDVQTKRSGLAFKQTDTRFLYGLEKKPRDCLSVASPESRQALVAQASLRMEKRTKNPRLRDFQLFGNHQFGLDSGRQADSSHVLRDVRVRASMGDAGEPTPQDRFRRRFLQLLDDYGYTKETDDPFVYDYVGGDEEQAYSLNYDSNVFDVPSEWRVPFLIARGQTCERVRIEGHNLNSSVFPTDNRITIFSFNNKSHKFLEDQSPSALQNAAQKAPSF